jgi:hypothetical protein
MKKWPNRMLDGAMQLNWKYYRDICLKGPMYKKKNLDWIVSVLA